MASVTLNALTTTPPRTALGFLPALRTYNVHPTLPRISARTVIVSGDLDPLTPAEHSRDLAAAIPGAHHINVAGAGHMLPQQAPDVIHRAITDAIRHRPSAPARRHRPPTAIAAQQHSGAVSRASPPSDPNPFSKGHRHHGNQHRHPPKPPHRAHPSRRPDHASRHIPIGSYTDDPAANARHSADIADMMADRSRGSADGRPRVPRPPSTRCGSPKSPPIRPSWPLTDLLTQSEKIASRPKNPVRGRDYRDSGAS